MTKDCNDNEYVYQLEERFPDRSLWKGLHFVDYAMEYLNSLGDADANKLAFCIQKYIDYTNEFNKQIQMASYQVTEKKWLRKINNKTLQWIKNRPYMFCVVSFLIKQDEENLIKSAGFNVKLSELCFGNNKPILTGFKVDNFLPNFVSEQWVSFLLKMVWEARLH